MGPAPPRRYSPLLVFSFGAIFIDHVLGKILKRNGGRTATGWIGAASAPVLVALIGSGYLLQTLTSGAARRWCGAFHLALGLLFLCTYGIHAATARGRAAPADALPIASEAGTEGGTGARPTHIAARRRPYPGEASRPVDRPRDPMQAARRADATDGRR